MLINRLTVCLLVIVSVGILKRPLKNVTVVIGKQRGISPRNVQYLIDNPLNPPPANITIILTGSPHFVYTRLWGW